MALVSDLADMDKDYRYDQALCSYCKRSPEVPPNLQLLARITKARQLAGQKIGSPDTKREISWLAQKYQIPIQLYHAGHDVHIDGTSNKPVKQKTPKTKKRNREKEGEEEEGGSESEDDAWWTLSKNVVSQFRSTATTTSKTMVDGMFSLTTRSLNNEIKERMEEHARNAADAARNAGYGEARAHKAYAQGYPRKSGYEEPLAQQGYAQTQQLAFQTQQYAMQTGAQHTARNATTTTTHFNGADLQANQEETRAQQRVAYDAPIPAYYPAHMSVSGLSHVVHGHAGYPENAQGDQTHAQTAMYNAQTPTHYDPPDSMNISYPSHVVRERTGSQGDTHAQQSAMYNAPTAQTTFPSFSNFPYNGGPEYAQWETYAQQPAHHPAANVTHTHAGEHGSAQAEITSLPANFSCSPVRSPGIEYSN